MIPAWLHVLAIGSLVLAACCAAWIASDVIRRPQRMAIMDVVWPVSALFASLFSVWAYRRWGRQGKASGTTQAHGDHDSPHASTPLPVIVAKGSAHCGSACALADIVGEWFSFGMPAVLSLFGLGWLFEREIYARWVLDYLLAFVLGIVFQYFAIAPMRHLSLVAGIWAAIKADTLSLTAWQLGMYGFMAVAHFWFFPHVLGTSLEIPTPEFWFVMQLAMLCGFATSYPVNWWLVRKGWKEKM